MIMQLCKSRETEQFEINLFHLCSYLKQKDTNINKWFYIYNNKYLNMGYSMLILQTIFFHHLGLHNILYLIDIEIYKTNNVFHTFYKRCNLNTHNFITQQIFIYLDQFSNERVAFTNFFVIFSTTLKIDEKKIKY